jgi:hypothetical protein
MRIVLDFCKYRFDDGAPSRQIPDFEDMKSLREIFKAAKVAKSMSTRQERKAREEFEAERRRGSHAGSDLPEAPVIYPAEIKQQESLAWSLAQEESASSSALEMLDPVSEEAGGSEETSLPQSASFSLAALINQCADDQDDLRLPDISLDSSLTEIAEVEEHPSAPGRVEASALDVDDDDEVTLPCQPVRHERTRVYDVLAMK